MNGPGLRAGMPASRGPHTGTAALVAAVALAALGGCGRPAGDGTPEPPGTVASAPAPAAASAPAGPLVPPTAAPPAPTAADRQAGAQLASQGQGNVAACASCHGAQGEGNAAAGFPRIAGQSHRYLLQQLQSYADGSRNHPVMGPIAQGMTPQQRFASAAHYASLPPRGSDAPAAASPRPASATTAASAPGDAARGRQLADVGDERRMVQACANCHGPDGSGLGVLYPYLAGQHAAYLVSTLSAWRDGSRRNDPSGQMPAIAKALSDSDLQAVAAHYAGLRPPRQPRDAAAGAPLATPATSAVVSGPRPALAVGGGTGSTPLQGRGSEPGSPLTGGAQGPGGGGGGSGAGPAGSPSGNATTAPAR